MPDSTWGQTRYRGAGAPWSFPDSLYFFASVLYLKFPVSPYRSRFDWKTGKLIGSIQYFLSIFTLLPSWWDPPLSICHRMISLRGFRIGSVHALSTRSPIKLIRGSTWTLLGVNFWIRVIMVPSLLSFDPSLQFLHSPPQSSSDEFIHGGDSPSHEWIWREVDREF